MNDKEVEASVDLRENLISVNLTAPGHVSKSRASMFALLRQTT